MSVRRKLKRAQGRKDMAALTKAVEAQMQEEKNAIVNASAENAIAVTISVAAETIYNHWRELAKKKHAWKHSWRYSSKV